MICVTSGTQPPHDVPAPVHVFSAPRLVAPSATAVQICDFDTLLHEQIWAAAGSASTPIAGFATPSDDGRIRNSGDSGSSMRFSIICSSVPYSAASPTITAPCRNLPQSDTTSFVDPAALVRVLVGAAAGGRAVRVADARDVHAHQLQLRAHVRTGEGGPGRTVRIAAKLLRDHARAMS